MFQYFQCIRTAFQNIATYCSYKKSVLPVSAFMQTRFSVFLLAYTSVLVNYCTGIFSA